MTMYMVKGVPSADILQVCEVAQKDSKTLQDCIRIGLSQITAPKVGRSMQDEIISDEKWGWEAREFVRKCVIGKQIKFLKENAPQVQREIGEVLFQKEGKLLSLQVELAREGLCDVSERAGQKGTELASRIADASIQAVENKKGKYGTDSPRADVTWEATEDEVTVLGKEFRGKQLNAVVEKVMSGGMMRLCVVPQHIYLGFQLTGIMCDRPKAADNHTESEKDRILWAQMAEKAKAFTERMLTHRDVQFIIDGCHNDLLQGTIVAGEAVFQELLLKNGFAKVHDPTVAKTSKRNRLLAAEDIAKQGKIGRWANLESVQRLTGGQGGAKDNAKPAPAMAEDFTGELLQVQSPDTIIILDSKTQKEIKVSLANVRGGGDTDNQPPKADDTGAKTTNKASFASMERKDDIILYKNFFLEGRDFVAQKLHGQEIKVCVDYMAQIPMGGMREEDLTPKTETRIQGSVYYKAKDGSMANIATELIKAGLAVNIFSKDGKAKDFFDYSDAFDQAKEQKRGIHGNRAKGEHKVQDIQSGGGGDKMSSSAEKKGRAMLTYLQRSSAGSAGIPKLKATVEYVLGPARVKLYIPRENAQISLNIAGLAAPNLARTASDVSDPCAQEALTFSKLMLNQREIEVQVEHFHKGTFVGNVWIWDKVEKEMTNVALKLLASGYATMEGQNTQSMVGKTAADSAQAKAQKERKGIWGEGAGLPKRVQENIDKFERRFAGRTSFQVGASATRIEATLTDLVDSTTFFFQTKDTTTKDNMKKIDAALHGLNLAAKTAPEKVDSDSMVAAMFSDKKWYRGRVIKGQDKKALIHFIDFGNKDFIPLKDIRNAGKDSLLPHIPPQANEGHLAFMHKLGLDELGGAAARDAFEDFTEQRDITVAHEYTNNRKKFYTIRFGDKPLQADLVKRGLGLVALDIQENAQLSKPVGMLVKLENAAKQSKMGMWRDLRGDPRSYDDEDY